MAVFGAPVAHEDDAERAVRAGLRILEALEELNGADARLQLQVRIGINTGESLVALGAHPELGEGFVTGHGEHRVPIRRFAGQQRGDVSNKLTADEKAAFSIRTTRACASERKKDLLTIWKRPRRGPVLGSDVARSYMTPLVGREISSGRCLLARSSGW